MAGRINARPASITTARKRRIVRILWVFKRASESSVRRSRNGGNTEIHFGGIREADHHVVDAVAVHVANRH